MEGHKPQPDHDINFSDHLIESNISSFHRGSGKLFEIKDNPDKIVRKESFSDIEKRYKGKVDPIVVAEMGQELYRELQDKYGIEVPVEFVIGKDDKGEDVIYSIVDKIDGSNLDKIEVVPGLADQVEKLYAHIAQYFFDKFSKTESLYLADINNASQYVYGKKKGDEVPRIYLVDTDLYIRDGKVVLCNNVLWLFRHMTSVEKKYGKKFIDARRIIRSLYDLPLPQHITEDQRVAAKAIIAKAKGYMDGSIRMDDEDAHPIFSDLN